ncbi:adenylate and Guanylate cyclase catalytic domain protein [Lyngbya aestuarii BL J]|uniref:Adenylate and Guanylate cyclase catalytic domain protein n=1 Tax=Lyngbya aestuarii BL J TaxID=1348334 RepID=U7QMN5_9CYAN|nr:adenylate/guanylate cyclase domain-containing protein [Lyngbya aestuarii]ERT08370.1 adenylate and Guanylate cyclase catalytic domain protein [Lyngbya aestuarii BL J]
MWAACKRLLWDWRGVWITTPSVAVVVILLRLTGILESLEWSVYDQYMRLRPVEPSDERIAIIGLDEADMKYIGQGYVPDGVYADLLRKLIAMQPRAIGLDIYRDLPYEPGHEELVEIFKSTPNLVGVEKVIGDQLRQRVSPPPQLKAKGQTGANDLILDEDNTIRRALLVQRNQDGETYYSFPLYLAMLYLQAEGISPQVVEGTDNWWKFGDVLFTPFQTNDGGYVGADAGGYQVFLNYRGPISTFETVPYRDILEGQVPPDWGRDRIILIGSVGESFQDLFVSPYTLLANERIPGVEIHANITSQIISAALDDRPLIKTASELIEWQWILIWSAIGASLTWKLRSARDVKRFLLREVGFFVLATGVLFLTTYLGFLQGWWIPIIPPFLAMSGSAIAITAYVARSAAEIRKTFGRYLSDEIVSTLLESPTGLQLGGERRRITILTSDLRGFTALSERLSPEEVIKVLNFYLSKMADVITQYKGTIDEFMGDGILVLFGAPTPRPDDAKRAIACAVSMQLAMVEVNKQIEAWDLNPLEMGIGINTGEVVVGNLGSEKRSKYGVVGSQVNLTYRIESYTTGGQIIISGTTLKEAGEDLIEIENQKLVQPKGVKRPITIYEVGGIRDQYNLFLHKEEEIFYSLSESILLNYTILEGKHVGENLFPGVILELSNKGALILAEEGSESLPTMLTNIKLNLKSELPEMREDIYAKVSEKPAENEKFYIRFTSKPPAVEAKLDEIYKLCSQ